MEGFDTLIKIAQFCFAKDVLNLRCINRIFYNICGNNYIWKKKCKEIGIDCDNKNVK